MKKFAVEVLSLVAAGIMVGCATLPGPRENLNFGMPKEKQYKYVKEFNLGNAYLTRFVWEGESIENWTEALEIFNTWRKNYPSTPEEAYKSLMDARKKKCPESVFKVINQDLNSMFYEIKTINCPPNPDEYSITKLLYGKTDVFNLIYTNKTKDIPEEVIDEWVSILSNATITTGDLPAGYKPVR